MARLVGALTEMGHLGRGQQDVAPTVQAEIGAENCATVSEKCISASPFPAGCRKRRVDTRKRIPSRQSRHHRRVDTRKCIPSQRRQRLCQRDIWKRILSRL
jgi:hypothetical protein